MLFLVLFLTLSVHTYAYINKSILALRGSDPLDTDAILSEQKDEMAFVSLSQKVLSGFGVSYGSYDKGIIGTFGNRNLQDKDVEEKKVPSITGDKQVGNREVSPRHVSVHDPEISELLQIDNRRVRFFIKYYRTKGFKDMERWLSRSHRYLPVIKKIIVEEGLPEEIAYLPLIESGFNPNARSRAGAVGIWQFMKGTARKYGLRVDWWIDERKDPEKSTYAAVRYLKDLYERFHSWTLALAAYNAGEGRVLRAVRRNKTSDYWKLIRRRFFIRETRSYIPKFIAAVRIIKNPEEYGFKDLDYKPFVQYEKVSIPSPTDLKVIARAAGVPIKSIVMLNPELKRWFTPPDYSNYMLKIPYGKKDLFTENFAKVPSSKRLVFYRHRVRYGETLIHIARRYGAPVKAIKYLNNIKDPRRVRAGSYIVVPVRAYSSRRSIASDKVETKMGSYRSIVYTVKKGDTLWDISRSFGIDLGLLYKWNDIDDSGRILPGDRIKIHLYSSF